ELPLDARDRGAGLGDPRPIALGVVVDVELGDVAFVEPAFGERPADEVEDVTRLGGDVALADRLRLVVGGDLTAAESELADLPALCELRVGYAPVPMVGRLQALLVVAEDTDA